MANRAWPELDSLVELCYSSLSLEVYQKESLLDVASWMNYLIRSTAAK